MHAAFTLRVAVYLPVSSDAHWHACERSLTMLRASFFSAGSTTIGASQPVVHGYWLRNVDEPTLPQWWRNPRKIGDVESDSHVMIVGHRPLPSSPRDHFELIRTIEGAVYEEYFDVALRRREPEVRQSEIFVEAWTALIPRV